MKLLTIPAWHPKQWVVPVTEPPTAPSAECNCGFGGFHDDINPRCHANTVVPFRGRIAICSPCTWCEDGCDITSCQDCGKDYSDPCARHVAAGHIVAFDPDSDGVDCSTCCAHCNGLGHLIVASAVVDDVVSVVDETDWTVEQQDCDSGWVVVTPWARAALALFPAGCDGFGTDITDHLAFATFTSGMSALILSDVSAVNPPTPVSVTGEWSEK